MALDEVEKNVLNIGRIEANYVLSTECPNPQQTKDRLDSAFQQDLGDRLCSILKQWFSENDASIWFIRSLEIEASVNAGWEREQIASTITQQVSGQVRHTLTSKPDGENVIRFPDRTAFLAHFLVEILAGTAWQKWYFEAFEGLKLLPPAAAFRTAVCEDSNIGLAALRQLPESQLKNVIRSLDHNEIRRILETFALKSDSGSKSNYFQKVWEIIDTSPLNLIRREEEWPNAMHIYLQISREDSRHSGIPLLTAITSLLRLALCLGESSIERGKGLLAALIAGNLPDLYKRAGSADGEALSSLLVQPPDWLKSVGTQLEARMSGKIKDNSLWEDEKGNTRFGGLFLLLPILDELPFAEYTEAWAQPGDTSAPNLLRFLILVKCCGGRNMQQLFVDPLVRNLLHINPELAIKSIVAWQDEIKIDNLRELLQVAEQIYASPQQMQDDEHISLTFPEEFGFAEEVDLLLSQMAYAVLGSFRQRLPGFAASSIPFIYHNFLDFPASIEKKPDRLVVSLGNPPLRLVLNLTGMMRRSYLLDWLDNRPIELFDQGVS